MIREQVPPLVADIAVGRMRMVEPLLELLLLPLALQTALLLFALTLPFSPVRWYAAVALGAIIGHVCAAIAVGGGAVSDLMALAFAPFYIVWKLALAPAIVRAARKDTEWVRTARDRSRREG
jgi:hypothetical protein